MIPHERKSTYSTSVLDLSETSCSEPPIASAVHAPAVDFTKYPTAELYSELGSAIADYVGVADCPVIFGNGSAELIDAITAASPYPDVIIVTPTFFLYERAARKYNRQVHYVAYDEHGWPDRLLAAVTNTPALVWIVNPNNPTTHTVPSDLLSSLMFKSQCLVVVDESFGDFTQQSLAPRATANSRLLVVRSFSKAFGLAGARIGYCIGQPQALQLIQSKMDPLSANRIGVVLALRCLRECIHQYRAVWAELMTYVAEFASSVDVEGVDVKSGPCNFVSLRFDSRHAAKCFFTVASEQSLLLRAGWHWEFSGDGSCLIRVSIPSVATRAESEDRIRNVIAVFHERERSGQHQGSK